MSDSISRSTSTCTELSNISLQSIKNLEFICDKDYRSLAEGNGEKINKNKKNTFPISQRSLFCMSSKGIKLNASQVPNS
ncbi:hypothetical protein EYC84_009564 [Monilinia fructicola]|uniref:Uncharacterized protein n=1 Tax=Monilinia fructicola TaxID=38448 RepID=A0A5M9JBI1_MONFR|nr:hypothetical protein EYC84_009564 [Monilinia fructicola]